MKKKIILSLPKKIKKMSFSAMKELPLIFFLIIMISSLSTMTGCMSSTRCCLGLPEFTSDYEEEKVFMVEMRDGVELCTNVYFPEGKGPWPVVLIRSPYDKYEMISAVAKLFAYYGYVGIHQDCRGMLDSKGDFFPFIHERNDGADTLEWLVDQPWHDGNIALFGQSYFAFTNLVVADILPPEVKTIIPLTMGTDMMNLGYENGMCRTDTVIGLTALMHDRELDIYNGRNFQKALDHLPVKEVDELYFGRHLEWFHEFVSLVDGKFNYPEHLEVLNGLPERIKVPVLMISGWYDLFTETQLDDFMRLQSRSKSRILVTPWAHLLGVNAKGEKDFPEAGYLIDYFPRILNWLGHHLRGEKLDEWGPIEIYAIGNSKWETYKSWPPKGKKVRYHISNLSASKMCDDGKLEIKPPKKSDRISFVYDPLDPVPTRGGHSLLLYNVPGFFAEEPVCQDQDGLCEREDVLTFTTETLKEPLSIRGNVRVSITVSSDAEDTAFTAKLIEIDPDGLALNITDSIQRLAFRNGAKKPVIYKPGEKVTISFDLHPVAWTLKPGYKLRLDISSSNYPAFHAHSNTAGAWAEQGDPVKATQTVYTGGRDSSFVELPVIE